MTYTFPFTSWTEGMARGIWHRSMPPKKVRRRVRVIPEVYEVKVVDAAIMTTLCRKRFKRPAVYVRPSLHLVDGPRLCEECDRRIRVVKLTRGVLR